MGSASNTVARFSNLKSTTLRSDPSDFLIISRGEQKGDLEGSIIPIVIIFFTSVSMYVTLAKGTGYDFLLIDVFVFSVMKCSSNWVSPGTSEKIPSYYFNNTFISLAGLSINSSEI